VDQARQRQAVTVGPVAEHEAVVGVRQGFAEDRHRAEVPARGLPQRVKRSAKQVGAGVGDP